MELEITFDGDAPGLREHRLSIGAFGDPLKHLLSAARRIASNLVRTAAPTSDRETRGRLAKRAKQLDIEIIAIREGSTGLQTVIEMRPPVGQMARWFEELPERTGMELLEAIDQERKGFARNASVRKYLQSMPPGIHRQRYELRDGSSERKIVEFATVQFAEVAELPSLREVTGQVVGVGFEPGKNEVRLNPEASSSVMAFSASREQVDLAIKMRNVPVRTFGVTGPPNRLLKLQDASAPRFQMTPGAIRRHIFDRWHNVLSELAK